MQKKSPSRKEPDKKFMTSFDLAGCCQEEKAVASAQWNQNSSRVHLDNLIIWRVLSAVELLTNPYATHNAPFKKLMKLNGVCREAAERVLITVACSMQNTANK